MEDRDQIEPRACITLRLEEILMITQALIRSEKTGTVKRMLVAKLIRIYVGFLRPEV